MTPEDVRILAESIQNGTAPPWWSYVIAVAAALAGAFLGAYIKRKGEDRASKENFETLRDQLQKTTRDTEEIKSALSNTAWISQQSWTMRERLYSELVTNLALLKLSIEDRKEYFDQPGSEHNSSIDETDHFKRLRQQGAEAFGKLRNQIGPASIFLSKQTITALESLVRSEWHASVDALCSADYLETFLPYAEEAYALVLDEAQRDLQASQQSG